MQDFDTVCQALSGLDFPQEYDEARAALLRLAKDAQRYRWLRDEDNWGQDNTAETDSRWGDLGELHGDSFDDFVDAAMSS